MTEESQTPRWHYRFANYRRAVSRLQDAVERLGRGELDELGREGLVQRFEYTFELGWKTLADYLAEQGVTVPIGGTRGIIRAAFESGIIGDGDGWIEALKARNESAHVYDEDRIDAIIIAVGAHYLQLLVALKSRLERELEA